MSSQDVGFWFFRTEDKTEDPKVFQYVDIVDEFEDIESTLSQFLSYPVRDKFESME
jgi:hypothetical protein